MSRYHGISLVVIAALGMLIYSGCQKQAKVTESELNLPEIGTKPHITFENTVYDFGEIAAGNKYKGQFKFTNTGNGVLEINDIGKCCGAVVTLDKKELTPGQIVFAVISRLDTNEPSRLIASSIGVAIPKDPSQFGYLSEHHEYGQNDQTAGDYAVV